MSNYDSLKQINKDSEETVLEIKKNFPSFPIFFKHSKEEIYKKMIDLFQELLDRNIKSKILHVNAMINGVTFSTKFNINVEVPGIITEVIIPHFEEGEDYEFCYTAMTVYEKLIKH
jgi:hypothetical protein